MIFVSGYNHIDQKKNYVAMNKSMSLLKMIIKGASGFERYQGGEKE
jgi:hypothetical protein